LGAEVVRIPESGCLLTSIHHIISAEKLMGFRSLAHKRMSKGHVSLILLREKPSKMPVLLLLLTSAVGTTKYTQTSREDDQEEAEERTHAEPQPIRVKKKVPQVIDFYNHNMGHVDTVRTNYLAKCYTTRSTTPHHRHRK